jgi:GNAT superfamily N-acetyltransferase
VFTVTSAAATSRHLPTLWQWCIDEWGEIDDFRAPQSSPIPPLLAVNGEALLGGLVFTWFRKPGAAEPGYWINAVIVAPPHRRLGVATALIRAAEQAVLDADGTDVYALTDIPALYRPLGWTVVNRSDDGYAMGKVISGER